MFFYNQIVKYYSSICISSCARRAARLDSNSDSLRPWSSPCFAFGESENNNNNNKIRVFFSMKQLQCEHMLRLQITYNLVVVAVYGSMIADFAPYLCAFCLFSFSFFLAWLVLAMIVALALVKFFRCFVHVMAIHKKQIVNVDDASSFWIFYAYRLPYLLYLLIAI